jgi:hypothetical protein
MGIQMSKEVTLSKDDNYRKVKELEDTILSVAIEPSKGISPQGLEQIRQLKESSEFWASSFGNPIGISLLVTVLGAGLFLLY